MLINVILLSLVLSNVSGAPPVSQESENPSVDNNNNSGNNSNVTAKNSIVPSENDRDNQPNTQDDEDDENDTSVKDKQSLPVTLIEFIFKRIFSSFSPMAKGLNLLLVPMLAFARILLLIVRGVLSIVSPIEKLTFSNFLKIIGMGRLADGIECVFTVVNHTLLGISCALSKMTYFGWLLSSCNAYGHTMDDNVCIAGMD